MIITDNKIVAQEARHCGIEVLSPYCGIDNVFFRQVFKIFSRFKFLKKIFYNRKIKKCTDSVIIVFDSGMTADFLCWIKENQPDKKLIFWYWNPIRTTISLSSIPNGYTVWTYSRKEAADNNVLFHEQFFVGEDEAENVDEGYVFFIGKDKGRFNEIKQYEKILKEKGIPTKFIVVSDRRKIIKKDKEHLNKPLDYKSVQELIKKCHVVFDYCLNKEDGLSLRPLEAVKYDKLLVTNNQSVLWADFYNVDDIFLLNQKGSDLVRFCNGLKTKTYINKQKYSFQTWYNDLCQEEDEKKE